MRAPKRRGEKTANRETLNKEANASIAHRLGPQFGDGIRVVIDTDRIDALASGCAALWERVTAAPFLTLSEKREAVGYAPVEGGDRLG